MAVDRDGICRMVRLAFPPPVEATPRVNNQAWSPPTMPRRGDLPTGGSRRGAIRRPAAPIDSPFDGQEEVPTRPTPPARSYAEPPQAPAGARAPRCRADPRAASEPERLRAPAPLRTGPHTTAIASSPRERRTYSSARNSRRRPSVRIGKARTPRSAQSSASLSPPAFRHTSAISRNRYADERSRLRTAISMSTSPNARANDSMRYVMLKRSESQRSRSSATGASVGTWRQSVSASSRNLAKPGWPRTSA